MAHLISEHDSVFFGSAMPAWHGLGNVMPGAVPLPVLVKAMDYQVDKVQLQTPWGAKIGAYATYRTLDNGERYILADSVRENYRVIQNRVLLDAAERFEQAGCTIETGGTLDNGRRPWILLHLAGSLVIGKNDQIRRYILVSNDHTGRQSARVGFTSIRVVCANTLGMAENSGDAGIRVRHQGDATTDFKNVLALVDEANGKFIAYGEQLEQLRTKAVNQGDLLKYVREVFMPKLQEPAPGASVKLQEAYERDLQRLTRIQSTVSEIFQVHESVAGMAETRGNMYGAYQSINFYLNHLKTGSEENKLMSAVWGRSAEEDTRALRLALAASK